MRKSEEARIQKRYQWACQVVDANKAILAAADNMYANPIAANHEALAEAKRTYLALLAETARL